MFYQNSKQLQNSAIKNSLYLYLSHFADYILSIIFLPFIARILGASEFGKIALAQSFGIFIILILEFGSPLYLTREVARNKENKSFLMKFISTSLSLKITIIPIVLILSFLSIIFVPAFSQNPTYLIIVFIGSVAQGFSPAWYFYGLEQIKTMSLYKFLFRLFGFLLLIIFSNSNEDGWIVLASLSLSSILITIFLYIEMIKQTGFLKLSVSNDIRKLFFKSLNSFFITAVPHIYQNLSIIAMSSFVSPLQLGLYFGASRIHRAFNTLFGPLSLAFFPMISYLNEKNKSMTGSMMRKYSSLMFCIGLVFFLINFFFTKQIISLLLGNDYSSAKNILIAFSFVFPLTAISNALGRQWLMVLNKDHVYSFSQIFSSLAAFLFMIIFIKKIGIIAFPFSLIFFESLSILIIIIYMIKIKI